MRLTFCGVRGSRPAPGSEFTAFGGHTSCVALARDGGPVSLVLDAGTGLTQVGALLDGRPFRGDLLVSHLHWDHVMGLPFFSAADRAGARTTVHVPAADDDEAVHLLDGVQGGPYFPVSVGELDGDWTVRAIGPGARWIDGWDVLARWLPHGRGRSLGYRVSDGRSSVAYVTDHGPAGPGDHHDDVLALADGADVLVHDAQHTAEEWPSVVHFGHASMEYAVELAQACGVGRVVLFHHAPGRTDAELTALAGRFDASVSFAVEGETIEV